MPTYIDLPSLSAGQVLTASYLNQLNDNLRVIGNHNHSGSAGEGAAIVTVASGASPYVNRHEVPIFFSPSSQNFATWTPCTTASIFFGGYMSTNAACPASLMFPISIFSGEYVVEVMSLKNASIGIASVLLGTSVLGEINGYGAAPSLNQKTSFNASVPTSGCLILTFRAWGDKHALAEASTIKLQAFKIRKTGAY